MTSSVRATVVCLLALHSFGSCVIQAVQIDAIISDECRQHCVGLSTEVDFDKCMVDCLQFFEGIGSDGVVQASPSALAEFMADLQQRQPTMFWPSHRQSTTRDDVFVNRKRLVLSPRAASLVGSGSAHQYLRIGRSYGGSETAARPSLLESDENSITAAGSRYPIERRNVNSLTGSRLASAAKSYLRVGKKDAETPEAPSS